MLAVASHQHMHWPCVCVWRKRRALQLCSVAVHTLRIFRGQPVYWSVTYVITCRLRVGRRGMWIIKWVYCSNPTFHHTFHSVYSCFPKVFCFNMSFFYILQSFTPPPIFILCFPLQVAHDVDGLGNYLLLTHRHVAHLHPFSSYLCRQPCPNRPSWVLYHEFTISRDNCIRIASEVHPQMWVQPWDSLLP